MDMQSGGHEQEQASKQATKEGRKEGRKEGVPVCAVCNCAPKCAVCSLGLHTLMADGVVALSLAAASILCDCTSVHCATDIQGGWSGRLEAVLRNGYTQHFSGTLKTLVSHCTVLRVGESVREGRKKRLCVLWLWCRCSSRVFLCCRVYTCVLFAVGVAARRVSGRVQHGPPVPWQTPHRLDQPALHTRDPELLALPRCAWYHLGRAADVVSGVRVQAA